MAERFVSPEYRLDDDGLVSALDELPLWSAPFGLALLEMVDFRPGLVALDVGCGAGFPLLELAQRLGPRARVHGVDPWRGALARARHKLTVFGITNVTLHEARAEKLPLGDGEIDLIVSNNGFNNVDDLESAFKEAARVAAPGAQLAYTYNLPETMRELYDAYDDILRERGLESARQALSQHIFMKRKPVGFTAELLERSGFAVTQVLLRSFPMKFADATAMFSHFFVRLAFLPSWLEVIEGPLREPVFTELERRLDDRAHATGGFSLSVPFACFNCRRKG